MAPRAAQRKARENDYSNVGKAGWEEITGIFSSPQKALQNGTLSESTVKFSEEMMGMDSTFTCERPMLRLSLYDAQFLESHVAHFVGRFLMVYL